MARGHCQHKSEMSSSKKPEKQTKLKKRLKLKRGIKPKKLAPLMKREKPAPPEAYAALVRLYIEMWEKYEKNEQIDLIEKQVRVAQKAHSKYSAVLPVNGPFGTTGSMLYGIEFNEYVNQVWADFRGTPDNFAVYLQKDFERRLKRRKEFLDELEAKFQEIESDIQNMSDDEADKYLIEQEQKLKEEIKRRRTEWNWDNNYQPLEKLLSKYTAKLMSRMQNQLNKRQEMLSLDAVKGEDEDIVPFEIEDKRVHGLTVEDELAVKDIIDRTGVTLDELDTSILILKMYDFKNTEIAEKLGISKSNVTYRIKKIRIKMSKPLGIPLNNNNHAKKRKQRKKQSVKTK